MKILVFAASLRKDSFNRKQAAIAAQILGSISGVNVDHADYREFEMPIYDGDAEEKVGIPKGGQELIRRIRAADAIVISTPEYNGGIPGTLKNAIDWVSRDDDGIAFDGKPMLLLGASPGALGAVRGLWHTRVPLEAIGTFVYPEMFGLARAAQAFAADGSYADPKNHERLKALLADFVPWAEMLSAGQEKK